MGVRRKRKDRILAGQGGVGGLTGGGQAREIPSYGPTVVRWVYPLGSAPPAGLAGRREATQDGGAGGD